MPPRLQQTPSIHNVAGGKYRAVAGPVDPGFRQPNDVLSTPLGMAANIPDPGDSDRSPANAIPRHKTLMPVSSRPTCIPSTCAGSRSERNTNFKWDSAGLSGISGIPGGKWSCTPEGSCRREMVSRAHTDDATPRAHPAHVARSLSPWMTRSWRIIRAPCIAPWSKADGQRLPLRRRPAAHRTLNAMAGAAFTMLWPWSFPEPSGRGPS